LVPHSSALGQGSVFSGVIENVKELNI